MRKNSWVSLTLLFVTYFTFGWKLSTFDVPPHIAWIVSIVCIFVLTVFLSFPLRDTRSLINRWFKTDTGAFMSIILSALLAVIVVTWLHLFATALVLTSAGALARLDIQMSGFKKWSAFGVLAVVSLTGLGLGGTIEYLLKTGSFVFPQL
jgi:ABC-type multidrug transport system fused ATPase/permease subunit